MKMEIRYIEKIRDTFDQFDEDNALFYAYQQRQSDMIQVSASIDGKQFEFFCYADGDRLTKIPSLDFSGIIKRLSASESDTFAEKTLLLLLDMSSEFIKNKANRNSILGDFLMSDDIIALCRLHQLKYNFDKNNDTHVVEMLINEQTPVEWGVFSTLAHVKKAIDNYCHIRDSKAID